MVSLNEVTQSQGQPEALTAHQRAVTLTEHSLTGGPITLKLEQGNDQVGNAQKVDLRLISRQLNASYKNSQRPTPDQATISLQARKIRDIVRQLSPASAAEFMRDPYILENLVFFTDIQPEKIDLALTVSREVKAISEQLEGQSEEQEFQPQFVPALNLGSYIVLEYMRDQGLNHLTAGQAKEFLKRQLKSAEASRKTRSMTRGQMSLVGNIIGYLEGVKPEATGEQLEKALLTEISVDLHRKLERNTQELREFGQSQGIEIEVLRHITRSKNVRERRVDTKWEERGIPTERHKRSDWNLLPLLGIKEDIGEREHQSYEMATDPSESSAYQTTIMRELILAGFITEEALSDQREGYSLHISTIFPPNILNEQSIQEYKYMARALAGAFASDQRIAFGGFMSGGDEVTNKTKEGKANLREVGKRKLTAEQTGLSQDIALVEIRNLDINPSGQYSAAHAKNVLDYAFRCAWQENLDPSRPLPELERHAAVAWRSFITDLNAIFSRYGITQRAMEYKYGKEWESYMWQEVAQAREQNPQLRNEFASLIRRTSSDIRIYKRALLGEVPLPSVVQKRPEVQKERPRRERSQHTTFLTIEPHGAGDGCIYLNEKQRKTMKLKEGDRMKVRLGDKAVEVKVEKARRRDDGTVDRPGYPYMRLSKNVIRELDAVKGLPIIPVYDESIREMRLGSPDIDTWPVVRFPRPHLIKEERRLGDNRFYLSENEMNRMGLRAGDEITLRFGKVQRKVRTFPSVLADIQAKPTARDFTLSSNVLHTFGLTEGMNLKGRYDNERREFSIGPHIAVFRMIDVNKKGQLEVVEGQGFMKEMSRLAKEYGASVCVVDPNAQKAADVDSGYVRAYLMQEDGTLELRRMPIPDVIYDKDTEGKNEVAKRLIEQVDHAVFPEDARYLTTDKWEFSQALENNGLGNLHPDTIKVSSDNDLAYTQLNEFFQTHDSIFMKPRYGQQGHGVMRIQKDGSTYSYRYAYPGANDKWEYKEGSGKTLRQVLAITSSFRGSRAYIGQEEIEFANYSFTNQYGYTVNRAPEMRIIIQRGMNGKANITGIVARMTATDMVSTEYYLRPEDVVKKLARRGKKSEELMEEIRQAGYKVLDAMEQTAGERIGDIAIDVGIRSDGRLVAIEANSMSMPRFWFEEIENKDARYYTTSKPIEYALYLTDM